MYLLHYIIIFQVEVERRKESTTGSPLPQQIVETNRIPAPLAIKTPKTADKPRKGLPAFIWVIGIHI